MKYLKKMGNEKKNSFWDEIFFEVFVFGGVWFFDCFGGLGVFCGWGGWGSLTLGKCARTGDLPLLLGPRTTVPGALPGFHLRDLQSCRTQMTKAMTVH